MIQPRTAPHAESAKHGYVLMHGRHVGAEALEKVDVPLDEKLQRLTGEQSQQPSKSAKLEKQIGENLEGLDNDF